MSWVPDTDTEDDDGDDANEFDYEGGTEAIIFLIDAFLTKDTKIFEECLDIIRKSLLSGLLIKEKDLIGIVFCNTEHSPEPKDIDGIKNVVVKENTAIFLPLKALTRDIVAYYLDFSSHDTDHFDFSNTYGCKIGSFANSIWLCTNMFKQCATKLSSQNIIMFTAKDFPPDVESDATGGAFQKAIKKASDLNEIGIDFTLVPMIDHNFDYTKFYKEFICTVQDIELDEFPASINAEEIRKCVSERQLQQNFKKQCNVHLRWILNNGLEISISMYNYYRKNIYPKTVKLLREDSSVVECKHVYKIAPIDNDIDERICRPGDTRKVIEVGGQKIAFTSDELAKMRSPLTPRLTLLGFKPRDVISVHNFIRSTQFLYPDENVIEGSTKLFRTLWEKCIEKQKVAICVLVSRRKSPPRYVALVPTSRNDQQQSSNNNLGGIQKDGFKVVYLPFEIDYRDVDLSEWNLSSGGNNNITESQVELFRKMIKRLKYQFTPTKVHDPTLEKLRTEIIGLALDVEPEDEDEYNIIDVKYQDSRIHEHLANLKIAFGEDTYEGKKRGGGAEGGGGRQAKVPKVSSDENVTEEQILDLVAAKNLNKLTVKQLKSYLQNKDVKGIASATKSTLIEKIFELHS